MTATSGCAQVSRDSNSRTFNSDKLLVRVPFGPSRESRRWGLGGCWIGVFPGLLDCRIPGFPHRHPQAPNTHHTPDKSIKIRKPQHQLEIGWGMA